MLNKTHVQDNVDISLESVLDPQFVVMRSSKHRLKIQKKKFFKFPIITFIYLYKVFFEHITIPINSSNNLINQPKFTKFRILKYTNLNLHFH